MGFRDLQPLQIFLVIDRLTHQLEAHRVDLGGRRLDLALDFLQREGVIGALVPIAFAVDGVEIESRAFRGGAPVVALGAGDALHRTLLAATAVMDAAAVMNVTDMAAMDRREDALRGDAEATPDAAIGAAAVRRGYEILITTAIGGAHPSHRHGAGRSTSHHSQHDTARAFHGTILAAMKWSASTVGQTDAQGK